MKIKMSWKHIQRTHEVHENIWQIINGLLKWNKSNFTRVNGFEDKGEGFLLSAQFVQHTTDYNLSPSKFCVNTKYDEKALVKRNINNDNERQQLHWFNKDLVDRITSHPLFHYKCHKRRKPQLFIWYNRTHNTICNNPKNRR